MGKKIKLARVEINLNQAELAEKIGSKQKSISRYETGVSLPSLSTLSKIAKILKKPASYFFSDT